MVCEDQRSTADRILPAAGQWQGNNRASADRELTEAPRCPPTPPPLHATSRQYEDMECEDQRSTADRIPPAGGQWQGDNPASADRELTE
ncbi:hypothetical protein CYMTET_30191, partial [Cymbomonas tetramitiformis]